MFQRGKWLWCLLLCLGLTLITFTAFAAGTEQTLTIDCVWGEEFNLEIYRDNHGEDTLVGFIAKRDGGNCPNWVYIYNSFQENPRYAWIQGTAKEVGEWTFRAGVFEVPHMSKKEIRLATFYVTLRVKPTEGDDTTSLGTGYVLCESLSLKQLPSASSDTLLTLSYGSTFQVHQEKEGWYYIDDQGTKGWVNTKYVLLNPSYYTTGKETPAYAYGDQEAKRVGLIDPGVKLPVIAELADYYVVSLRGASAFIAK